MAQKTKSWTGFEEDPLKISAEEYIMSRKLQDINNMLAEKNTCVRTCVGSTNSSVIIVPDTLAIGSGLGILYDWLKGSGLWLIQTDPEREIFHSTKVCELFKNSYLKPDPIRAALTGEISNYLKASSIDIIENIYEFPESQKQEIELFLKENEYLLPILMEAQEPISSIFGKNVKVFLELLHDPEESGWDELFIVIKSKYSAKEAVMLENKLVEEWFLDKIEECRGKLNITEEPL